MKYKVGDKVRIVSKWGKGCYQNREGKMDKWLGKEMTIIDVVRDWYYQMREDKSENDGFGWYWSENSIAGLACEKKIVITSEGEKTLARLYDRNKVIKTATAKCAPDDKFSFETGAKIAFNRLFEKHEKEEPKYFNGKAVCDGNSEFIAGKIYIFIDGQRFDDEKNVKTVGH